MRDKFLKIRVSEKELFCIKERAKKAGMNISRYVRKCTVDGKIILYDTKDVYGLKSELKAVGRNINQIAVVVNSTGSVFSKDIEDMNAAVITVTEIVKKHLAPLKGIEL